MRRARQRSVAALLFSTALAWLSPATARAFHAGNLFDKPPGAGGGGGLFYTGAPRDKGWTCAACHVNAPGKIQLNIQVDPADLFQTFRYAPGQTYSFTVTMSGESAGLGSPLSNFNALAVSLVDPAGAPVGSMTGFAADELYAGFPTTLVSAGQRVGATSWTFQWIAGEAGSGPVTIYVAAVDGNGADSPPNQTLTDPFGDDVYTGEVNLTEGAATARAAPARTAPARGAGPSAIAALACAAGLALATASRRRRTSQERRTD